MTTEEYVKEAVKTNAGYYYYTDHELLHAAMGICTEAGEFMDAMKKCFAYGKVFDETNLQEELGDLMWYIALACHTLNVPLSYIMELNINKLKLRYPEKFSTEKALNRDLAAERVVLESGAKSCKTHNE